MLRQFSETMFLRVPGHMQYANSHNKTLGIDTEDFGFVGLRSTYLMTLI